MDNICHTLVGAAIGEAGLKRRTRLATPVLIVAANLPDIDVLVFATDMPSVAFRRGWTHGALAQVLLPVGLTALVAAVARVRRRGGRADPRDGPPLHLPWILALSFIGVVSHVMLDYLNTYGVRLLTPLDWRWFYGDAVFIIDVWLWAVLGSGIWLARRLGRPRPAQGALAFAAGYVVLMLLSAQASRGLVMDTWRVMRGTEPDALMVGPLPVTPFSRAVIVDRGDRYETGTFSWLPFGITFLPEVVPKRDTAPEVARARASAAVQGFLVWSRFPYWEIQHEAWGARVTVRDMRFGDRFSVSTLVPDGPASSSAAGP
jgi:inner membrane protein